MHGHGSARAERVHSNIFWGKTKSGCSQLQTPSPDDSHDVGCTDRSEAMIRGKITDGGGGIISLVTQAEEDVDARLDWAGCGGLRTEVGNVFTADGNLLIVEGDENLGGLAEMLDRGVPGEEKLPNEEQEVHEGPELDCPAVAGALRVFAGLEAEIEANGDRVGCVVRSVVRRARCCGNNGVHDYQGDGLFLSDGEILEPVGIEFPREALVKTGV